MAASSKKVPVSPYWFKARWVSRVRDDGSLSGCLYVAFLRPTPRKDGAPSKPFYRYVHLNSKVFAGAHNAESASQLPKQLWSLNKLLMLFFERDTLQVIKVLADAWGGGTSVCPDKLMHGIAAAGGASVCGLTMGEGKVSGGQVWRSAAPEEPANKDRLLNERLDACESSWQRMQDGGRGLDLTALLAAATKTETLVPSSYEASVLSLEDLLCLPE